MHLNILLGVVLQHAKVDMSKLCAGVEIPDALIGVASDDGHDPVMRRILVEDPILDVLRDGLVFFERRLGHFLHREKLRRWSAQASLREMKLAI